MIRARQAPLFRGGIWLLVFCVFVLASGRGTVRAEEIAFTADERAGEEVGAAWDRFRGALDGEAAELTEGIDPADPVSAARTLSEALSPAVLGSVLRGALIGGFEAAIPAAVPLFGLLLLAFAAKSADPSGSTKEGAARILRLAEAVVIFRLCGGMLDLARRVTDTVCRLAEMLVPAAEAVCLMGGGVTEGRVVRVGILLLLTVAGEIVGRLLVPLAGALMGLDAVSGGRGLAAAVSGGLRKTALRIWQFLAAGLSFLLASQTVLGRASDSLGQRWMRFAVSSFVPVAGSAMSEAWGVLSGSVRILRGVVGIGGILALCAAVLAPAVRLLLWQWIFGVGKAAAESADCPDLARLLESARGTAELLCAFTLYTLFLLVLQLAVFAGVGR